jgi:sugar lactone lactonase YvrE
MRRIVLAGFALVLLMPGLTGVAALTAGGNSIEQGDASRDGKVRLSNPQGVAVDATGNVYVADTDHNRVLKVAADGTVIPMAGTGHSGFSGDRGPAAKARLDTPTAVAVDSTANVYIADSGNSRVRRISPDGTITTVVGTGHCCVSGDGGSAAKARLNTPTGLVFDIAGNLYIADGLGKIVRRVGTDGTITTVAGTGRRGFSGDGGSAAQAPLGYPWGLAVDGSGNVYIADGDDRRVRVIRTDGIIATAAGIGIDPDVLNNLPLPTGLFTGDGTAAGAAQLSHPTGVAVDSGGNLYIADEDDARVREVNPAGIITTVVGNGLPGTSGDGAPASQAQVNAPHALTVDAAGNLYVTDTGANRVRRVGIDGTITTVVGN